MVLTSNTWESLDYDIAHQVVWVKVTLDEWPRYKVPAACSGYMIRKLQSLHRRSALVASMSLWSTLKASMTRPRGEELMTVGVGPTDHITLR